MPLTLHRHLDPVNACEELEDEARLVTVWVG